MSHRLVLAALAAAALAAPATAMAAAPWSAPATVPGAGAYSNPVVVTPKGHAVMTAAANPSNGNPSEIVPLGLDGTPGTQRPVGVANALLTAYASDHVAVAGSTVASNGTVTGNSHVQVATGSPGGNLGPLRGLSGTTGQRAFAIAGNTRGDLAVITGPASKTRTVYLRRAGSSAFKVALKISVGSKARGATVALGPKGDVLAVWDDNGSVYARHLGTTGNPGAVHKIGSGAQSQLQLQAAIDGTGRLEVAWESQQVSNGFAHTPATVRFSTAAPGHGFGSQRTIETVGVTGTGRYVTAPGVRLVVDGSDRSLLAWTGYDGAHFVARAQDIAQGHRGTVLTLSPAGANAVLADAAADLSGAATVVWRQGVAGNDPDSTGSQPVVAAHRAAGAAFGAPERVSADADTQTVTANAGLDPVSGRSIVNYALIYPGPVRVSARP